MDYAIDHIILLVPDLPAYVTEFEQGSGVTPKYGGMQPNAKVANALVDLGNGAYLEILGPSPGDEVGPMTERLQALPEPTVAWFALQSFDLDDNVKRLEAAGLEHSGVLRTNWESSERGLIDYSGLVAVNHGWGDQMPFYIDWHETPHPSSTSPGGITLSEFTVYHPDARNLGVVYGQLGVNVEVKVSETAGYDLVLETPKGELSFSSRSNETIFYVNTDDLAGGQQ